MVRVVGSPVAPASRSAWASEVAQTSSDGGKATGNNQTPRRVRQYAGRFPAGTMPGHRAGEPGTGSACSWRTNDGELRLRHALEVAEPDRVGVGGASAVHDLEPPAKFGVRETGLGPMSARTRPSRSMLCWSWAVSTAAAADARSSKASFAALLAEE